MQNDLTVQIGSVPHTGISLFEYNDDSVTVLFLPPSVTKKNNDINSNMTSDDIFESRLRGGYIMSSWSFIPVRSTTLCGTPIDLGLKY